MGPAFFLRPPYSSPQMASLTGSSLNHWEASAQKKEPQGGQTHSHPWNLCPQSQLPPSPGTTKQDSESNPSLVFAASPPDMASLVATGGSSSSNNNKQIPLLCTVCPETPRFSDVSHLLTHIASKGHLHHETQTKLKAHQDISASVTLQQYEQWYRENGIEALLVERMKAKQLKEAARNRRSRGAATNAPIKQKRKNKRSSSNFAKPENESFSQDFPIFPGFFPTEIDNEIPDDFLATGDMMALKGQVWPGMGKMDLANEDMKRTRNQRKPKSVIERMRRTSEGIEPTQVVMTPEFEVERIKDVYDSSSPIPGQEEATPQKKATKPRRKRPEPLAEVSVNVPRGARRSTRGHPGAENISKAGLGMKRTPSSEITPTLGHFKRNFDVFRDEDVMPGAFEDRHIPVSSHREAKFDLHGRVGLRQLNPISHSNLVSPTPSSRDIPDRTFSARDVGRARSQGQPYLGMNAQMALGSMNHQDMSYTLHDPSMYSNTARMSLATGNQFGAMDQFHLHSNHHATPKFDDFPHVSSGDVPGSVTNQFLNLSGANPFFAHDRLFLGSCGQPPQASNFPGLGFTPINRQREASRQMHGEQDRQAGANMVKLEPQLCEVMDNANAEDPKDSGFNVNGMWETQAPENDMGIADELQHEALEI